MRRLILDLRRRGQSAAIRFMRRSRFFPRTVVNRLGDDDALVGARTDAAVLVYVPGALDTLYQVTPWLPTLEAVHDVHGALVVCQDSRVTERLRSESRLPVLTIARYGTLDGLLGRSDVKLALYASHAPRNFECLRFSSLLHAYIGHGDSDKGVSASNQLKAYDFVLAPGQAAIDRVERRLMRFDAEERCIVVGQPLTLAAPAPARTAPAPGAPGTVLYAPTWEGAQPSVAYSSVLTHGRSMIEALLADGRFAVVYRPHPLVGVTSRAYAGADQVIRSAVASAGAPHRVVEPADEPIEASFAAADVLVTDVSAVATAWLPSLRPLAVTMPAAAEAVAADSGMLSAVPRVAAEDAGAVPGLLAAALDDDEGVEARRRLVAYYLSTYWPDGVLDRFVSVVGELIRRRDADRATLLEAGATGT